MSASNSVLSHIARPYAAALFDLATEAKDVDGVESALDQVAALANDNQDFSNFLRSPVISGDEKIAVIGSLVDKAGMDGTVANFLRLVARNKRLFALEQMISEFKQVAAKARGEVSAEVISAAPLSAAQQKSLADAINKKLGNKVTLNTSVDPSLIGGLQVKVGSQMIDTSLRTKLTAMKIAMKEVG